MGREYAHRSAFLPPELFDVFWRKIMNNLREDEETDFADYFEKDLY